jgi:SAM-dependent methyltransferase
METLVRTGPARVDVDVCTPCTPDAAAWGDYYEHLYRSAGGDAAAIPWARGHANPWLVEWLNSAAPSEVRPGARVTVVGCGLGEDVAELAQRGYDVTGFDVSPAAIEWARTLHPACGDRFLAADLMALPRELLRRSDLVVEVHTIQALPPELRVRAAVGLVALMRPHGCLLTLCRGRDEGTPLDPAEGPPFPLTPSELTGLFGIHGLTPVQGVETFVDDESKPRLRAAFRRR